MDLRYLNCFVSVAKHQSLTRAAEELKIAVSAVSRQMNLLEAGFGKKLFVRYQRKLILNDDGEELFKLAEEFQKKIKKISEQKSRATIRLGCLQSTFEEILIQVLKDKKILLDVKIGYPHEILNDLLTGKIDIAITTMDERNYSGLDKIKLYTEVPVLVNSNLKDAQSIIFTPYEDFWPNLSTPAIRVNSLNAAVEMSKARIGATLIPKSMALKHNFKDIVGLAEKRKMPIYFCTGKYSKVPVEVNQLLKQIRTHIFERKNKELHKQMPSKEGIHI